jgi:hypothetical protein
MELVLVLLNPGGSDVTLRLPVPVVSHRVPAATGLRAKTPRPVVGFFEEKRGRILAAATGRSHC